MSDSVSAEYRYSDSFGNEWHVYFARPDSAVNQGAHQQSHWRVSIRTKDGAGVSHGDRNLACAVARAVEKARLSLEKARLSLKDQESLRWTKP